METFELYFSYRVWMKSTCMHVSIMAIRESFQAIKSQIKYHLICKSTNELQVSFSPITKPYFWIQGTVIHH